VCFAWFCNAAMHLGMSDLSILRFARKPSCGWATAGGMFLGHYIAWICAALLLVYWVRVKGVDPAVGAAPGPMVDDAVGMAGLVCVVVAGWTTANPTIYRAGLAFQGLLPRLSRVQATVVAGAVCTLASIFPATAMKLLDFVGIYGTILAPVGAVIAVEHVAARSTARGSARAADAGPAFNTAFLIAWTVPVAVALWLYAARGVAPFFLPLPAWIASGLLYALLSKRVRSRSALALEEVA
jgi:NCS1 family nucleobase:cation symporter-1